MQIAMHSFEQLRRLFYFYESLALYEVYYDRLHETLGKQPQPGREEDRPITWVPLVFHCTTFKALTAIMETGVIRPGKDKSYVSFTEVPITELHRLRSLGDRVSEVAIGFPRVRMEALGLFQPAYLKHASKDIKKAFCRLPSGYVELKQDLGALNEVRMPSNVPFSEAVYILSTVGDEETCLDNPILRRCMNTGIACSYWHPEHQKEMVKEATFRTLLGTECRGEFYLPEQAKEDLCSALELIPVRRMLEVKMPDGKPFNLGFPSTAHYSKTSSDGWVGPFTKVDMASFFFDELHANFPKSAAKLETRIQFPSLTRHSS